MNYVRWLPFYFKDVKAQKQLGLILSGTVGIAILETGKLRHQGSRPDLQKCLAPTIRVGFFRRAQHSAAPLGTRG